MDFQNSGRTFVYRVQRSFFYATVRTELKKRTLSLEIRQFHIPKHERSSERSLLIEVILGENSNLRDIILDLTPPGEFGLKDKVPLHTDGRERGAQGAHRDGDDPSLKIARTDSKSPSCLSGTHLAQGPNATRIEANATLRGRRSPVLVVFEVASCDRHTNRKKMREKGSGTRPSLVSRNDELHFCGLERSDGEF